MRIVADVTIAGSDWFVDHRPLELGFVVTLEAERRRFALERVTMFGSVGVMALDTGALGHGCMNVVFEHHVAAGIVTRETELLAFGDEFEFVLAFVGGRVADRAHARADGSVHPLSFHLVRMAFRATALLCRG